VPRFQWVGWTYFAMIWVSSVHLGWHYVSDGIVGSAGALLIWQLAAPVANGSETQSGDKLTPGCEAINA
jgi:hypothetical protein